MDKRRQIFQITYPDGRTVDYQRNAIGQVAGVTTTLGGSTVTLADTINYAPFGPLQAMTYGNGIARTLGYDGDYRLTAIQDQSGTAFLDRSYTLDNANNISAITDHLDANHSQGFSYDALNRLTGATGIYGTLDYGYDANGNRLSETRDGQLKTYTYDTASHHLLETNDGTAVTYSYDANGNTVDATAQQFSYGDNNRLKTVSVNAAPVATYTYNGKGERVKKTGLNTTYYYYDQVGRLIAETDAAGTTLRDYVYLNGQPLALISNGTIDTLHTDHLGTPQVITDENQNVVWQADYEPFGRVNITTASVENNLRFPGQYYDQETGLYQNGWRTYAPSLGRYIQSDALGLNSGINTYIYALNNSIRFFDQDGLKVRFICREVVGLPGRAQHCFVYVTCPSRGIYRVLSLFATNETNSQGYKYSYNPFDRNAAIKQVDWGRDNPSDPNNTFDGEVKPNMCFSNKCGYEDEVLQRYDQFPSQYVPYNAPFGPNSNTFAKGLLGNAPLPPGAPGGNLFTGAPGINDSMQSFKQQSQ